MVSQLLSTRQLSSSWAFWVRGTVVIVLLSVLLPASLLINSPKASASAYNCYGQGNHCYGKVTWDGGTWGYQTHIYMNTIYCTIYPEQAYWDYNPPRDMLSPNGLLNTSCGC